MSEQRSKTRQRVLKAGTISFNNGAVISCVVRNISVDKHEIFHLDASNPSGGGALFIVRLPLAELELSMALAGCASLADIGPELLTRIS